MYKKFMKTISIVLMSLPIMLVVCTDAQARTSKEVEVTFYSDASMKTEVGYQLLPCNGGIIKSGKRTKFFTRTVVPCENPNLPSPPPINCNFTQAGCDPFLPVR